MAVCEKCGWWKPICKCTKGAPAIHIWKPRYFEHLDVKPVWIESKRQLREECKKRNLKAACLM